MKSQRDALLDELGAQVGRHDHDRVLEIDLPAQAVGQHAVIQHLKQHVEDVGVGFLDLIKQHHRVGTPTDLLRQLPAFLVSDVSRGGSEQTRTGELFLVFRHVDANQGVLCVEEEFRQGSGQFRLPNSRGAQEDK